MLTATRERQDLAVPSIDVLNVRVIGPVDDAGALSMRRYASELTEALQQLEGLEVSRALAPGDSGRPPLATARRRIAPLRALGRLRARTRQTRASFQARRVHGDVLHLIDQRDTRLIDSLPAGRTVQTVHDLLAVTGVDVTERDADQMRRGLAAADRLVAISEATRAEILEHVDVPADRVSVIANGLGEQFRPIPPARLSVVYDLLPRAHYRVLHVASNAQARKNLPATLRVLHALRQQGLDAILVRIGVPLPEAEQRLAHDLGVTSQIADLGYVTEDRLVELYNAAHVLLFPSSYEGFGWPPLEAMACGLPVVASNAPALPETLGQAALFAAPHDIEALTSHVASVLTDGALAARLSEAGRAHAAGYSWERTAARYAEIYRSLLDD